MSKGKSSELGKQIAYLENLVFRLSQELSRQVKKSAGEKAGSEEDVTDLPQGVSLPAWLSTPDAVSPLLDAFDDHVRDLKRLVEENETKYAQLQEKATLVAVENDSLHEQVLELTEQLSTKVQYGQFETSSTSNHSSEKERLRLLEKENDLLRSQNGELGNELSRLHEELDAKKDNEETLQEDNASLLERFQLLQRDSNSLKARIIETENQLQKAKAGLSRNPNPSENASADSDQQANAPAAVDGSPAQQHRISQLERVNADLEEEVSRQRELASSARADVEELRSQANSSSGLTSKLESRAAELQSREFELSSTIQKLNEEMAREKARSDIAHKVKEELGKEVEALGSQLRQQPFELKEKLSQQYQERVSVAESSAKEAQELLVSLRNELSHWKSTGQTAQRDAGMLEQQLQEMKEMTSNYPEKISGLLKEIRRVEAERDSALHKTAAIEQDLDQEKHLRERDRKNLSAEKSNAQELSKISVEECAKLRTQLEGMQALSSELEAKLQRAIKAKRDYEEVVAQNLQMQSMESAEEIKTLKKRLNDELEHRKSLLSANREKKETERILETFRVEAREAQRKAESIERDLTTDKLSFSKQVEELNEQNAKLQEANQEMAKHIRVLTRQNKEAQVIINEADSELAAFRGKLQGAFAKEGKLRKEKEEAYSELEFCKLEATKAKRAHVSTQRKVDHLRIQCESLQHALSIGQPLQDAA